MRRLCERPGCSEPASVAYGMRAAEMVFWLDRIPADADPSLPGVLCVRHADAIVVPRNWTLDDLRDPDLHLFRPPPAEPRPAQRQTPAPKRVATAPAPLPLDETAAVAATDITALEPPVEPWTPSFDEDSDLDGLLSARSPLLSRAFRGTDLPRER